MQVSKGRAARSAVKAPAVGVLDYSESMSFLYLAERDGLVRYAGRERDREEVLDILSAERSRKAAIEAVLLFESLSLATTEEWDGTSAEGVIGLSFEDILESSVRTRKRQGPWLTPAEVAPVLTVIDGLAPYLWRKYGFTKRMIFEYLGAMQDPEVTRRVLTRKANIEWPPAFELHVMDTIHLLGRAAATGGGIVSNRLRARKSTTRWPPRVAARSHGYRRAFSIVLDEVRVMPTARTIAEAIDLRAKLHIRDFREVLWRWSSALQDGDTKSEARLRSEVGSASRSLKRAGAFRQVGALVTYASLPLAIVPALGLPLTALGVATQAVSDVVERRHRWLAFKY